MSARRGFKRFCPRGHDKMSPHSTYIKFKKDGRISYQCAICTRERWNRSYHEKQRMEN